MYFAKNMYHLYRPRLIIKINFKMHFFLNEFEMHFISKTNFKH